MGSHPACIIEETKSTNDDSIVNFYYRITARAVGLTDNSEFV
ncbi:MAG: hypothetical protein HRU04_22155 [Oceanospirillaceae bacterium]|nr:hypothetical protein [Oceanospirillaceae bacterium]